jgi:hypothetical protein
MKRTAIALGTLALLTGVALGTGGCVAVGDGGGGGWFSEWGGGYDAGAVDVDYSYNDFGGADHSRPPYDKGHPGDGDHGKPGGPGGGGDHGGGDRGGAPSRSGGSSGGDRGGSGGPPSIPHESAPDRGGGGGGGGGGDRGEDHKK